MPKLLIPEGIKKVAAMCILRHQHQYLLLERAKMPNQGMYVPVGGKLEPFEDPRSAAIRETQEETGIELSSVSFCGTLVESAPNSYNWVSYIYLADIDFVPPPPCDEGRLHWIKFDQLLQVPTPPTDWWIYQFVLQKKPFAFNALLDETGKMLEMREEITNQLMATEPST